MISSLKPIMYKDEWYHFTSERVRLFIGMYKRLSAPVIGKLRYGH